MKTTLKRDIGFEVQDTGHLTGHHTSANRKVKSLPQPWTRSILEFREIQPSGLPRADTMFSRDLAEKVRRVYRDDLELYSEKFGGGTLDWRPS